MKLEKNRRVQRQVRHATTFDEVMTFPRPGYILEGNRDSEESMACVDGKVSTKRPAWQAFLERTTHKKNLSLCSLWFRAGCVQVVLLYFIYLLFTTIPSVRIIINFINDAPRDLNTVLEEMLSAVIEISRMTFSMVYQLFLRRHR